MKANEPDTLKMECYFADESSAVIVHDLFKDGAALGTHLGGIVHDLFKDGAALGTHLGGTAAHHFPRLSEIAVPGPFLFCGDVPDELKQAVEGMNMGAIFGTRAFGFTRSPSETS